MIVLPLYEVREEHADRISMSAQLRELHEPRAQQLTSHELRVELVRSQVRVGLHASTADITEWILLIK